jgi:hypothetical protein
LIPETLSHATVGACTSYTPPTAAPTSASSSGNGAAGDDGYFNDDYVSASSSYSQHEQANNYQWYIGTDGTCLYQTVCQNYEYPCKSYQQTTDSSSSSSSTEDALFQCTAYPYDASFCYFAAPHCAADGQTLQLGLFTDSSCGELVRTSSSVGTGSRPLFSPYVDKTCIPCNIQESIALITDAMLQGSGGNQQTNPLCAHIFEQSAQCNSRLTDTTWMTDQDKDPDPLFKPCATIATIRMVKCTFRPTQLDPFEARDGMRQIGASGQHGSIVGAARDHGFGRLTGGLSHLFAKEAVVLQALGPAARLY